MYTSTVSLNLATSSMHVIVSNIQHRTDVSDSPRSECRTYSCNFKRSYCNLFSKILWEERRRLAIRNLCTSYESERFNSFQMLKYVVTYVTPPKSKTKEITPTSQHLKRAPGCLVTQNINFQGKTLRHYSPDTNKRNRCSSPLS